ncbi:MAG: ribonuclease P protein component [Crenarchaeota archaeon]|nr:ribonuclease P protein component [Actinomycetota bacterium]NLE03296.1 ribonuclease P protein component [Thermoproteota archaeon]
MPFTTIKRKSDFNRIYHQGQRTDGRYLKVYIAENDLDMLRAGISTGKYIGNSVVRNRIRRIIKEVLRKTGQKQKGLDLLIIAKKESAFATYEQLKQFLNQVLSAYK